MEAKQIRRQAWLPEKKRQGCTATKEAGGKKRQVCRRVQIA